jgi:hypothetical protein
MYTVNLALTLGLVMVLSSPVCAEKTRMTDPDVIICLEAARKQSGSNIVHITGSTKEGKFRKIDGKWFRIGLVDTGMCTEDDVPHVMCLRTGPPPTNDV